MAEVLGRDLLSSRLVWEASPAGAAEAVMDTANRLLAPVDEIDVETMMKTAILPQE